MNALFLCEGLSLSFGNGFHLLMKYLKKSAVFVLLIPGLAIAKAEPELPNMGAVMLQTLLGLGFVIACILLLAYLSKRFNVFSGMQNAQFKTLGMIQLGTKEKAVLIDVAGKQLLLGVAPGRVSTLHVFEESMEVRETEPERHSEQRLSAKSPLEFSKKLNEFLSQNSKNSP